MSVANAALAERGASQYPVALLPDGQHLLVLDSEDRLLLWVAVTGPTGWDVTWGGWVTADGRTCDTLAEVEEAMGL